MENTNTKDNEKRANKKFLYKIIKTKFRNLFGTCSSSDKALIHKILDEKYRKNDNTYDDKNTFDKKTCLQNDIILIELSSDSEDSLDERSTYKAKQGKYVKDLSEENENEITIVQGVSKANVNTSDKSEQCSPKSKPLDIDKTEDIKKLPENTSCIDNKKEDIDENNQIISNLKNNYKTIVENECNVELYVEVENEYTVENNTIAVYQTDDIEPKIIEIYNGSISDQIQIKCTDHNEENIEQDKNCKSVIFRADFKKPDVERQNVSLDHNPQNVANHKEIDVIVNKNKGDSLCDKNETEQGYTNNVKLIEKKDNCDENIIKATDTEPTKDYSYLQILNTQSIVLEVESILFKTVLSLQNPKLYESGIESQMNTSSDSLNALQAPHIFGNNELSNILLQNVTLVYNYFRQYFRNVDVIEREGLDNFLKVKAREYIVERYCSLFYACYLKMPCHILVPNLHADIQYANNLIKAAKKLSNDQNFNEILFLEIFNSFLNFLSKFQREASNRQRNPNIIEINQGQEVTFNGNNQNNPRNNTENNIQDQNVKALPTNGNSKGKKQSLPQKRGRKPKQTTNSTATSNQISQIEVTPALTIHPMEYEYYIYKKSSSEIQPVLKDAVPQNSPVNPTQYTGTHNVHSDRNSYYSNQSTSMNTHASRNSSMTTHNIDVSAPLTHAMRPRLPSVSTQTQSELAAFLQRPPQFPYSRPQQANYYNHTQQMVPQNLFRPPNQAAGQSLPFPQYESLNEMYYYLDRTQPLAPRDNGFMNPNGPAYNDQMTQLPSNIVNPSHVTNMMNNSPINFAKNAVAACIVCKKSTTRRCEGCFSIFVCSKVCELTIMDTHKYFCKGQSK